jgi:CRP-like cAMP-binding protein
MSRPVSVDQGELLFEEGSPGDALYVILDGELEVARAAVGDRFLG